MGKWWFVQNHGASLNLDASGKYVETQLPKFCWDTTWSSCWDDQSEFRVNTVVILNWMKQCNVCLNTSNWGYDLVKECAYLAQHGIVLKVHGHRKPGYADSHKEKKAEKASERSAWLVIDSARGLSSMQLSQLSWVFFPEMGFTSASSDPNWHLRWVELPTHGETPPAKDGALAVRVAVLAVHWESSWPHWGLNPQNSIVRMASWAGMNQASFYSSSQLSVSGESPCSSLRRVFSTLQHVHHPAVAVLCDLYCWLCSRSLLWSAKRLMTTQKAVPGWVWYQTCTFSQGRIHLLHHRFHEAFGEHDLPLGHHEA